MSPSERFFQAQEYINIINAAKQYSPDVAVAALGTQCCLAAASGTYVNVSEEWGWPKITGDSEPE